VKRIADDTTFRYSDISRGGIVGLQNGRDGLVNICFQNSVLQSLHHARDFREDVIALECADRALSAEFSTFVQFQTVLGTLGSSASAHMATHALQRVLPAHDFGSGRQQDASEFLGFLTKVIDTVEDSLSCDKIGVGGKDSSVEANQSLIGKHFGATISTVNTCRVCGTAKHGQHEQCNDLALPFPTRFEPLTGICVISGKTADIPVPKGFERISVNLNQGRTGKGAPYVFVCVRRGDRSEKPITEVALFVRKHDDVPLHITAASMESGKLNDMWNIVPGSLNEGGVSTSEEVYIGFKREVDGSPIVNLAFLSGDETPKEDGFKRVNVDLNRGDGSERVFMCYQQNMPIVDIAIGGVGRTGFRFIDQNLRLNKLESPLYIMHTDNSASSEGSDGEEKMPITGLMLVNTEGEKDAPVNHRASSPLTSSYQRLAPGVLFDEGK
jgi:hypothetical protein